MKSLLLTFFIFLICVQFGQAQIKISEVDDSAKVANNEHVKNAVYLSLGGPAFAVLSLHYERKVDKQLWIRAGFSYSRVLFRGGTVPLGLTYLIGENPNFFELGFGTTFIYAREGLSFSFFDDDSDESNFFVGLTSSVGYRYQPWQENLFFKITFSPIYLPAKSKIVPFLGIGLGYSF